MKIYQLHEYSGEWEDFRDYIIGSYLRKERAEEEKTRAELKAKDITEQGKKCIDCPFLEEDFSDIDDLLARHSGYCSKVKLEQSDYGMDCENYYVPWDEPSFEIKEVEVEE